ACLANDLWSQGPAICCGGDEFQHCCLRPSPLRLANPPGGVRMPVTRFSGGNMTRTASALSRRNTLRLLAAAPLFASSGATAQGTTKPMRGVMPIVVTPYTPGGAVDYEDLARQMAFYDRCGCTGGAWPQGNGDVLLLSKDERMRGMKVIADAC